MNSDYDWATDFQNCYEKAISHYHEGKRRVGEFFSDDEIAFLNSIGCRPQEVYDFAEDWCRVHQPDFNIVLLVTAVRRDYFLVVQEGEFSSHVQLVDSFPAPDEELEGIPYLPRILAKARAKLRGELPPNIMFCCGGDRPFLQENEIHPADFLRAVWAAGTDDRKIVDLIQRGREALASL